MEPAYNVMLVKIRSDFPKIKLTNKFQEKMIKKYTRLKV